TTRRGRRRATRGRRALPSARARPTRGRIRSGCASRHVSWRTLRRRVMPLRRRLGFAERGGGASQILQRQILLPVRSVMDRVTPEPAWLAPPPWIVQLWHCVIVPARCSRGLSLPSCLLVV